MDGKNRGCIENFNKIVYIFSKLYRNKYFQFYQESLGPMKLWVFLSTLESFCKNLRSECNISEGKNGILPLRGAIRILLFLVVVEWAHLSSNSSFIMLQNFEFKHLSSSRFLHFFSLSSSFGTSSPSFGQNILTVSSFIEFKFALNRNDLKFLCLNATCFRVSKNSSFKH